MKLDIDIPAIESHLEASLSCHDGLYMCKHCKLGYSYRAAEAYQWSCCGAWLEPILHTKEQYDS